ncbi:MAG: carbohydrate ABC transporter permease [Aggregatilineales bacterium]
MATATFPLSKSTAVTPPSRRRKWAPYLFLAAPLALYFTWIIGPSIATAVLAATNWDGIAKLRFADIKGNLYLIQNVQWLLNNDNFWTALGNNIKWLLFFLVIPTSMGLAMAMIFNSKLPGSRFFKIAFYSPLVLATVVTGLIWGSMYNPQIGLLNSLLHLVGISNPPNWLGDRGLVLWSIIFAAAWRQVGYVMILYLAGLKGLDTSLIEAATVDGATFWQRFRHVIFPLLAPVTVVVMVISVIDSLRAFDLVSIMTNGGPDHASEVLANFMYISAFNNYEMGHAAIIALVLFLLMACFIVPYLIYIARTEMEY